MQGCILLHENRYPAVPFCALDVSTKSENYSYTSLQEQTHPSARLVLHRKLQTAARQSAIAAPVSAT